LWEGKRRGKRENNPPQIATMQLGYHFDNGGDNCDDNDGDQDDN